MRATAGDGLPGKEGRCLGAGLSYRAELHSEIVRHLRELDLLELVADDFTGARPEHLRCVSSFVGDTPLVAHAAGLSIGSAAPAAPEYIESVSQMVRSLGCRWLSLHLTYSKVPGCDVGSDVPLWATEETLDAVCRNVRQIQGAVDVPLLLENATSYYAVPLGDLGEAELLTRALSATDSGLLLDVNNLHINSLNLGFDPYSFLSRLPLERVVQVHVAGGSPVLGMVVDSHGAPVHEDVWRLLEFVVRESPVRGVILEWDRDFPPFSVLRDHLSRIRSALRRSGVCPRAAH